MLLLSQVPIYSMFNYNLFILFFNFKYVNTLHFAGNLDPPVFYVVQQDNSQQVYDDQLDEGNAENLYVLQDDFQQEYDEDQLNEGEGENISILPASDEGMYILFT